MSASDDGHPAKISQAERFKQAAEQAEVDPDEKAWEERLKKVAKAKPLASEDKRS